MSLTVLYGDLSIKSLGGLEGTRRAFGDGYSHSQSYLQEKVVFSVSGFCPTRDIQRCPSDPRTIPSEDSDPHTQSSQNS